jgi:hypothetical protein
MATARFSRAPRPIWCSSLLLAALAGCSFDVHAVDLSFISAGDGAMEAHDLAGRDALTVQDLTAPRDLAVVSDLTGSCPGGKPTHVGDLAEGDLSDWVATALMPWKGTPMPPTVLVEADNQKPARGLISVRLTCSSDAALLLYPSAKNAGWDLSGFSTLDFFVAADDKSNGGWAETDPHVILATSDNDQFEFVPDLNQLPTSAGTWISLSVPLSGSTAWTRSTTGSPTLGNINYIAFSMTTRGTSFRFWVDGVTFGPGTFVDCTP